MPQTTSRLIPCIKMVPTCISPFQNVSERVVGPVRTRTNCVQLTFNRGILRSVMTICGRDCTSERLRTVINAIKKHRVVSLSVLEQVMDMLHSRFLSNIMDAVVPVVLFPTTASFQRVNHGVARIPIPVRPEPCPNPANYVHHTCRCEKLSLFTSESRRPHFPSSHPSSFALFTLSRQTPRHAARHALHFTHLFVQRHSY